MNIYTAAAILISLLFTAGINAAELYKAQSGPYPTAVASPVEIDLPTRERALNLRISYPENSSGTLPLIVFFHGALCAADGYAELADHWASHGYVVVLLEHADSGFGGGGGIAEQVKNFRAQTADMSSVLDSLEAIATQVVALKDIIDPTRVAAAGHSMGALAATIISGLTREAADGSSLSFRDERFDVAVLLSGPGPLPMTPEDGWDAITLPTLVTTGTRDHANRGGKGATWEWRLGAFDLTPPGDKFALVVNEADHFLGGLICTDRAGGTPDHEAFSVVKSVTTAFLDDYLKQDATARAYLHGSVVSDATDGRAEMRLR
jgi:dienelactone hydrolase